jgi:hypothetical protein
MDGVALLEEQFREVGAILAGYAGNERYFCHWITYGGVNFVAPQCSQRTQRTCR